jgi:hypothetical protein
MLLAVTVVAPLATGEKSTKPNKDKKTAAKTKKDKNDSSEEDKKLTKQLKRHFAEMAKNIELNTKQLEHFIKLQKDQEAKLKEWDKKNEKKIADIKKKLDASQKPKEQKALRGQLDKLESQRRKIVSPFDAKSEKVLNKKQKNQWDTHKLYYVATKERYAIYELDEEQLKKLKVACSRLVKGVDTSKKLVRHAKRAGVWLLKDKQMRHNLDLFVFRRIFNKEQQKAFRQIKKQEEMQKKLREEEKKRQKKKKKGK